MSINSLDSERDYSLPAIKNEISYSLEKRAESFSLEHTKKCLVYKTFFISFFHKFINLLVK